MRSPRTLDWPLMFNNITREDRTALIHFLKKDFRLTQSEQVAAFEAEWSKWLGVKRSVFVNSGSSANLMTLAVIRELYGTGEIIVPPLTWVSDIAAVLHLGFKPVFADINLRTLGMEEREIVKKITPKTRAVFLTHILGYNALTDSLLRTLKTKKIPLLEDACESHGATFKGRRVGTFGLMSNFSFYYAHHLSTVEGGMVSTNDEKIYQLLRMVRAHGLVRESNAPNIRKFYQTKYPDLEPQFIFAFPAYNFRSHEMNAVLGRSQLKRLDENVKKRNENLRMFLNGLDPEKYQTDFELKGASNYAFTLILAKPDPVLRDRVIRLFQELNVEYRRGTSGGGNQLRQPYLRRLYPNAYRCYPNTDHVHFYGFYIGNYPELPRIKIKKLCGALNQLKPGMRS